MSSEVIEQRSTEQAEQGEAQSNALTTAASPLDLPAEVFRAGLDRRKENRAALLEWVRSALVEGVDFGRIHVVSRSKCPHGAQCRNPAHFSKPSLFKPGAEKICGMLGVTIHYPTLSDYEAAALQGVGLAHIIMRCEIRDSSGNVVANGVGARSLRQDSGDLNKSLKMTEKSAHIDATLRMAGLSEIFTQDVEDMVHGQNMEKKTGNARPCAQQNRAPAPRAATQTQGRISEAQRQHLEARISGLNLDPDRVRSWLAKATRGRVQSFNELTPMLYRRLVERLDQWASQ